MEDRAGVGDLELPRESSGRSGGWHKVPHLGVVSTKPPIIVYTAVPLAAAS